MEEAPGLETRACSRECTSSFRFTYLCLSRSRSRSLSVCLSPSSSTLPLHRCLSLSRSLPLPFFLSPSSPLPPLFSLPSSSPSPSPSPSPLLERDHRCSFHMYTYTRRFVQNFAFIRVSTYSIAHLLQLQFMQDVRFLGIPVSQSPLNSSSSMASIRNSMWGLGSRHQVHEQGKTSPMFLPCQTGPFLFAGSLSGHGQGSIVVRTFRDRGLRLVRGIVTFLSKPTCDSAMTRTTLHWGQTVG